MREPSLQRVDVIIPVYKPGRKFSGLLEMLKRQTYPVEKIIIMNTDQSCWNDRGYEGIPGLEVHHVTKAEFDHGGTRNLGAGYSDADIMVFLTDDAVPKDEFLISNLVKGLSWKGELGETAAVAYAKQLPAPDCRVIERYTRSFNYPEESKMKTLASLPELGIKTYMASNVCCAYRRDIFLKLGGFIKRTIFNEDMIYAAGAVKAGYGIAYVADAQVIHSHNLSGAQQFHRNFDLAVSQADHPEVFEGLPSEGEGIRLVKKTAGYLVKSGRIWLVPTLVYQSGCKYAGYWLGKRYRRLPMGLVKACTMNRTYWNREGVDRQ